MKTNKILAVALSAGLVLGGASVAHAGGSGVSSTEEHQPADLDKAVKDAEAELKKAEGELAEAKAELAELWAEAGNAGSDDDTDGNAEELDKLNAKINELEEKVKTAKANVEKAKAEKEKAEQEKEKEPETTISDYLIAKNSKDGYASEEDAKQAAELAKEKNPAFNDYRIMMGENDRYYFTLGVKEDEVEEEKPEEKPEDKKTQTLDEWQIEQNEKDGYFTKEDALRAGNLALEKKGTELKGLYEVEAVKNAVQNMWFWRFVPVEASEEKPGTPLVPLTPAEEVEPGTPGTPWTPLTPGESDGPILGGDDKVVLPEEKPEDNKETEIEEEKPNEGKEKEEKAKEKEKSKPAKQKGNNPKTGLVGLAPIYSTLAISMAGIVAARKKND